MPNFTLIIEFENRFIGIHERLPKQISFARPISGIT